MRKGIIKNQNKKKKELTYLEIAMSMKEPILREQAPEAGGGGGAEAGE